MEIQGKVIAVLPIKDGVGKTSGNTSGRAGSLSSRRRKADRRACACS